MSTSGEQSKVGPDRSGRPNRRSWSTRFGFALLVLSPGCRQIVGFSDGSPAGADAGVAAEAGLYKSSSGWGFADPSCGACIDRSCNTEATACAVDPSCSAYETC